MGSYSIQKFSTTVDAELKRLKAQLNLFWDKEIRLYKKFGLKDGMAVVDCGSGPGYLTEKLLETFPTCHVTAVEIDPYLVALSKKRFAEKQLDRCTLIQDSVINMGLQDETFDFAIVRLLLEHLPDPESTVREIKRVLKPGGKAALVDNDFEMHLQTYPEIPELEELYNAYCKARLSENGRPKIGRELPGILMENGFINIDLEVVCAHSELVGDEVFLQSEGVGISSQLVKSGYLSSEVLDKIAQQWHKLLHKERHAFYRQLFVAVGEKPVSYKGRKREKIKNLHRVYKKPSLKREYILRVPPDERLRLTEEFVTETISASLHISPSMVKPDAVLINLGVDSLSAVEIQNNIKASLDVSLSIVDFFQGQSIVDVTNLIINKIEDEEKVAQPEKNISGIQENSKQRHDVDWEEGEI